MPTLAPPDTHELVDNDREVIDEEAAEQEEETPHERVCHLMDEDHQTLCGAKGLAMPLPGLKNPKASPCVGGCGLSRCQKCAALV